MTRTLYLESDSAANDDTEMAELADYLSGLMTKAEAASYRQKLVDNPALFRRVGPIMSVWYSPTPLPAEKVVVDRMRLRIAADMRRQQRWQRVGLAFGGLGTAAAAVVYAIMQIGTQAAPELGGVLAQKPTDSVPVAVAPPTPAPLVVAKHPRAPRRPEAPSVVTAPVAVDVEPGPVKTDSATERIVAAMDSAQALAEFIPSRMADTLDPSGVRRPTVWVPTRMDTGSIPLSAFPSSDGSNAVSGNQESGFWAAVRRLLHIGKKQTDKP